VRLKLFTAIVILLSVIVSKIIYKNNGKEDDDIW
jgi:hypothetical protein